VPIATRIAVAMTAMVPGRSDLLIRRSGHIVQDRPLRSVCWADIPALSAQERRCPATWQQYWLQSLRSRYWSRPSVFRPDISVGTDRARVMRCCRSLVLAAGGCCCCHRCCQPRSGRLWPTAPGVRLVTARTLEGMAPVSRPGSLPGPWLLARVLPEAQCQGWPQGISEGNAKRP